MKKKRSPGFRLISNPGPHDPVVDRHYVPPKDLFIYAQSFHKAAQTLAAAFQASTGPFVEADASAVVFIYRHAIELHLKALVLGDGGNFLGTTPDALSVHKTHSVSWLAQFVCQIITAVKWEKEFKCEGIENLADFKAVIEELNAVDPGSYVFRLPVSTEGQDSVPGQVKLTIREFGRKMDALLNLLDSTADALAATCDLHTETGLEGDWSDGGFEPPIQ
jgi:hypothetical protein